MHLGRDPAHSNSKSLTTEVRVPKVVNALNPTQDSNVGTHREHFRISILTLRGIIYKKNRTTQQHQEIGENIFFAEVRNNHMFFPVPRSCPDQTKRTASCLLARLIHIATKVREGSACEPRAAPLWAARPCGQRGFPLFCPRLCGGEHFPCVRRHACLYLKR